MRWLLALIAWLISLFRPVKPKSGRLRTEDDGVLTDQDGNPIAIE